MKHKRQWVCLGMAITMLAGCEGKPDAAAQTNTTQVLRSQIIEIASQINRAASAAVDPDTRVDGARPGPGLELTIDYTLVNAAANGVERTTFDTREAPVVTQGGCANGALRPLIDQGVAVVLEYRDLKGNLLGTATLNSAACSAVGNAHAEGGAD